MKPLLFGYQTVRIDAPTDEMRRGRRVLASFAHREGFSLGETFVEQDVNSPLSALTSLIESARTHEVAAVAVPSLMDLGRYERVQRLTRRMLESEAGVRVMVATQGPS